MLVTEQMSNPTMKNQIYLHFISGSNQTILFTEQRTRDYGRSDLLILCIIDLTRPWTGGFLVMTIW